MRILLIGCGSMGGNLLKGWLSASLPHTFEVATPEWSSVEAISPGLKWYQDDSFVPKDHFDAFIFGVTPMVLGEVLEAYQDHMSNGALVISMAAGKQIKFYRKHLKPGIKLVRIMPNLPVSVLQGMTLMHTQDDLTDTQRELVESLTGAVGKGVWLDDESLMNAGTALSGCGPGFIFELTSALISIGHELGLPHDVASVCARQTILGAGAYLDQEKDTPKNLANRVAHKGSMTEAGLSVLRNEDALKKLFRKTLQASVKRGEEF